MGAGALLCCAFGHCKCFCWWLFLMEGGCEPCLDGCEALWRTWGNPFPFHWPRCCAAGAPSRALLPLLTCVTPQMSWLAVLLTLSFHLSDLGTEELNFSGTVLTLLGVGCLQGHPKGAAPAVPAVPPRAFPAAGCAELSLLFPSVLFQVLDVQSCPCCSPQCFSRGWVCRAGSCECPSRGFQPPE